MILTAHIKTQSRVNSLVWLDDDTVKISVTAIPEKGKANQAIIQLLSKELNIPKSSIELTRGATAKIKQFKIEKMP